MGDAPSQLKTIDTLNGAALRTDEVELKHEGDESEVSYKTERLAIEYYDPKPGEFVVGYEDLLFLVAKTNLIFLVHGKVEIVKDDDEDGGEVVKFARQGMPVVEIRTMIFAKVLGRTLGGRHQVRQIKQLNEPNDVKITKCNIGGLLTRLEVDRRLIVKST
ncbi:hypothetical protein Bca4012_063752 [Brassica carinata]|uniref:Uncharacterized protein n=1 Tax=Brassica carinata TaxID=52824 RepID=A0A8X7SDS6_BRACI|nr:hypothetical protein Bca52824_033351 [Brassica carinata]